MKRKTFYEPPVCSSVCIQMEAFMTVSEMGQTNSTQTIPGFGDIDEVDISDLWN